MQAYQAHKVDARPAFEVAMLAFIQQLTVNPIYANAFFALAPYSTAAVVAELNVVKTHYVTLLAYWFAILPENIARLSLPQDVFKIVVEGVFFLFKKLDYARASAFARKCASSYLLCDIFNIGHTYVGSAAFGSTEMNGLN